MAFADCAAAHVSSTSCDPLRIANRPRESEGSQPRPGRRFTGCHGELLRGEVGELGLSCAWSLPGHPSQPPARSPSGIGLPR